MIRPDFNTPMRIDGFTIFLDEFAVAAEIGIHDFERDRAQRLLVSVSVDIDPARVPERDDIAATLDYDWIRALVQRVVAARRYELQETLCRAIIHGLEIRPEIIAATVETKKPDVYVEARSVGCRLIARRGPSA